MSSHVVDASNKPPIRLFLQALEKQHAEAIAALQASHDEKYKTLLEDAKKESNAAHSKELNMLREETSKAIEQMKAVHALEKQSLHESGELVIATIKSEW